MKSKTINLQLRLLINDLEIMQLNSLILMLFVEDFIQVLMVLLWDLWMWIRCHQARMKVEMVRIEDQVDILRIKVEIFHQLFNMRPIVIN